MPRYFGALACLVATMPFGAAAAETTPWILPGELYVDGEEQASDNLFKPDDRAAVAACSRHLDRPEAVPALSLAVFTLSVAPDGTIQAAWPGPSRVLGPDAQSCVSEALLGAGIDSPWPAAGSRDVRIILHLQHLEAGAEDRWRPSQVEVGDDRRTKAEIDSVIKTGLPVLRRCYQELLSRNRQATGRMRTLSSILRSGRVSSSVVSGSELNDLEFEDCTGRWLERLQFAGESPITILNYPFVFGVAERGNHGVLIAGRSLWVAGDDLTYGGTEL